MAQQSLAYVQKQLGHHSISMTVDTYGHWIPGEGRGQLDVALNAISVVETNVRLYYNRISGPKYESGPGKYLKPFSFLIFGAEGQTWFCNHKIFVLEFCTDR